MSLAQIAQMMVSQAKKSGRAQRQLSGGLTITLRCEHKWNKGKEISWTLSLTRLTQPVGAREQAICRKCFNIPADCEVEKDKKDDYHIVRLSWPPKRVGAQATAQMSLMEER